MHTRLAAAGLRDTADKLEAGVRLQLEDGVRLFECPDLIAVGCLANREREQRHGQQAFFNHNIEFNHQFYSNLINILLFWHFLHFLQHI